LIFHRLRIANYRGIASAEVQFSSTGITLIQGPNEVGKTSIQESIGLLFDFPDSSKHRTIEAIRPVHRDEGPEIELEAQSGPYAFTYFKRFYKKPETRLVITQPKPENLTGREAHERAEDVLRETLDIDLWKALTIQQGDAIQQPVLTKQTSLSASLDKAAGGRPADPREEGLFEKVRDEYAVYYTERGAERKELAESRQALTDARAEVALVEQAIHDLEHDIDRAASLQQELEQLRRKEEKLVADVASHTIFIEEINALESALSVTRLKLETARKSEEVARKDIEARELLIVSAADTAEVLGDTKESGAMEISALHQADKEVEKAQATFDEADKVQKKADALAALRREDFDYFDDKLHLDQLLERKERVDLSRRDAAQAEDVLTRNKLDDDALEAIRKAERAYLTASAKLELGVPSVLLRSLGECLLSIDDSEVKLDKGKELAIPVADKLRLAVPDMLEIEIAAGSSSEALYARVKDAQNDLDNVCSSVGLSSPDEAQKAFEERNEAIRRVQAKGQVEKENLRDLTYEQLEEKIYSLQQSVPDYLIKRTAEPAISPDLDSAKKEREEAETAQRTAVSGCDTARENLGSAQCIRDGLSTKYQETRVGINMMTKELERAEEALERARSRISDDDLDVGLDESTRAVAQEERRVNSSEELLRARNPEKARALAETEKGSLLTTQGRRVEAQRELAVVQTQLRIRGEEGLFERLQEAQTRQERFSQESRSLLRRAAAVKLLFESMRQERDQARKAYVAPLKENIERLGRLVFDDSLEVEISDDLRIAARTLGGITVPFESLSGGTQEQLSLIFRLACSMIVSSDGGTPLMLDDALGYTDTDRLRLMGAVLAKAAKECQIIIFTCVPDRYGNIGEATIVSMG
jgi:hypothetical protein